MKNNHYKEKSKEFWQPLPHVSPDTIKNKALFLARLLFDFEVLTTYKDIKKFLKGVTSPVLEVGCGLQPYRHLVPLKARYYAIDWEGAQKYFSYKVKNVAYYNGDKFPLEGRSFDFIFHTEVLEHIYNLKSFLSECFRVLNENGKMVFTIPFSARYHYIPNDYWRFTPAAIEKLLKEAGFKNINIEARGTDVTVVVAKINSIFFSIILRDLKRKYLKFINKLFFGILFFFPIVSLTLVGHLFILMKIGSEDDPLGYTVYCEK
jgi:SAM-dependent methyltransferase